MLFAIWAQGFNLLKDIDSYSLCSLPPRGIHTPQMSGEHVPRMETQLSYAVCSTWMRVEYLPQAEEMPSTCHSEPDNTQKLCKFYKIHLAVFLPLCFIHNFYELQKHIQKVLSEVPSLAFHKSGWTVGLPETGMSQILIWNCSSQEGLN